MYKIYVYDYMSVYVCVSRHMYNVHCTYYKIYLSYIIITYDHNRNVKLRYLRYNQIQTIDMGFISKLDSGGAEDMDLSSGI